MSAAILTFPRPQRDDFAAARAMIESQGWTWSLEGPGYSGRLHAYVHVPPNDVHGRRCFAGEGITPDLALHAAYRKAACRVALSTPQAGA